MTLREIGHRLAAASIGASARSSQKTRYDFAAEAFGCLTAEFHAAAVLDNPSLLDDAVLARIATAGYTLEVRSDA